MAFLSWRITDRGEHVRPPWHLDPVPRNSWLPCFLFNVLFLFYLSVELEKSKDNSQEIDTATEALKKQLHIEKQLKIQAVNKLAEIMCRKDFQRENSKKGKKATSDDLRKKEKECRKLHQELGAVC